MSPTKYMYSISYLKYLDKIIFVLTAAILDLHHKASNNELKIVEILQRPQALIYLNYRIISSLENLLSFNGIS